MKWTRKDYSQLSTHAHNTQYQVRAQGLESIFRALSPSLSSFSLSIAIDVLPGPSSAAPLFVRVTPCLAIVFLVRAARAAILARAFAKH